MKKQMWVYLISRVKGRYIRGEQQYYFTQSGLKNFANFVIYVAVSFVFSLGGGDAPPPIQKKCSQECFV